MADELKDVEITMDSASLYREETFTDRRVGTLQRLTPIDAAGARDEARPVLYMGQTQVLTPAGALPLSFEVQADSLEQAVARFGDEAKKAVTSAMQRIEEMRRDAASSLIVPGSGGGAPGGPGGPGGMGPGGMGSGGGIQMP